MSNLPSNEYVELRDEKFYYIPGTRIGLDVIVHAMRRGKSPEQIFHAFPSTGSLERVEGAITFILKHPEAVEQYLADLDVLWAKFQEEHPIPQHLLDRLRQTEEELARKSA